MRSPWKRLTLAACLSVGCGSATLLWYYGTEKKLDVAGETPLAQVSKVGDEVLRRPATRLLWQQVNTGDNLYNGETLRTSNRGELRIQFEDGRYIDLEPDSLIVLQKSKGEISLDLMEGSLFVNAKKDGTAPADGASPGLVLNSKNGKVDLTGASASLSKGSGDSLDLRVLEGKAKVRGADGKEKEITTGKSSSISAAGVQFDSSTLQILAPTPNKPTYIDPDAEKPVTFRWRGFPPAWKISVMVGPTRKEMREIATTEKPGDTEISTKLPLGKFWWRLVARDPATGKTVTESPTSRLDLQARYAPTVVFPVAEQDITIDKSPFDMSFKWQRSEHAGRVQIEVASDPQLRRKIANQAFTTEEQMTLQNLKEGTYYWRMSSFYEGSDKPVIGRIQSFNLVKPSRKEPVQIEWNLPPERLTQNFVKDPQLELAWEAKNRRDDIAGYRLKLASEQELGAEPVRLESKESKAKANVPKAGRYIASIEAYDRDGAVIGKSSPLTLAANELPRLSAPVLQPPEGSLQTGLDGRAELKWLDVQGAREYHLTIFDKSGKQIAKRKYETNSAQLKNLMPGEYTVKLDAVDGFGRAGEESPPRTLLVPEKSGLKAPTLKRIKVN